MARSNRSSVETYEHCDGVSHEGTEAALVAAGIVRPEWLPGKPGNNKTSQRVVFDGDCVLLPHGMDGPRKGTLRILRRARTNGQHVYLVRRDWSDEEKERWEKEHPKHLPTENDNACKDEDVELPENWIYEYWVVKPRKVGPPEVLGPLHIMEYTEYVLAMALSEDPRSSMIMGGYVGTDDQLERARERFAAQLDALKTQKALKAKGLGELADEFKVKMLRNIAWNTATEAGVP